MGSMPNFRLGDRLALGLLGGAAIAAACSQSPGSSVPTPIASVAPVASGPPLATPGPNFAVVDSTKITVSAPHNGAVTVSGAPGAVLGGGVATVSLSVIHDLLPTYRVFHLGTTYVVATGTAAIAADGGFSSQAIGGPTTPAQDHDKLEIIPEDGKQTLAGTPISMLIP